DHRAPGLWQTILAGDHRRRTFLQRCVRNEQQCNQHRTDHRKIGEDWHRRAPTAQAGRWIGAMWTGQCAPPSCLKRERLTGLSATDAWHRAESMMGHIQHLSFESLVKIDHFQKKPPPNLNIRFGSLADICGVKRHVRFTPKSGHSEATPFIGVASQPDRRPKWSRVRTKR